MDDASRSAFRVAARNAAHQVFEKPPVFDDPLALKMIGTEAAAKLTTEAGASDRTSRNMRALIAVRSRYTEDQLAKAVAAGTRQYVVLGAGLDSFAYRNSFAAQGLRVFEVDDAESQAWKQDHLKSAGLAVPPEVSYITLDVKAAGLTPEAVREALAAGGVKMDEPAFFGWLNQVAYTPPPAFDAVFAAIAAMPPGTALAFDYGVERSALNLIERLAMDSLSSRMASQGEPFQLFFTMEQLAERFKREGFRTWEDLDRDALNARYFTRRADGLSLSGKMSRMACVWR